MDDLSGCGLISEVGQGKGTAHLALQPQWHCQGPGHRVNTVRDAGSVAGWGPSPDILVFRTQTPQAVSMSVGPVSPDSKSKHSKLLAFPC